MFKTPSRSTKQLELQLVNAFVSSHDLTCHCKNPAYHCLWILTKQLSKELLPEEKNQIKQCLGEDHTTTVEDTTGLATEDLEEIFGQDAEEDTDNR